jgi:hypothetical protein
VDAVLNPYSSLDHQRIRNGINMPVAELFERNSKEIVQMKYPKTYLVVAALFVALVAGSALSGTTTHFQKETSVSNDKCFMTLNSLVKRHC